MERLPDELLQQVFAAVPQLDAVGSLPQVCRQFREALAAPSAVWERLGPAVLEHVTARAGGRLTPRERMALLERWLHCRRASVRKVECSVWREEDVAPCVVPLLRGLPALKRVSFYGDMDVNCLSVPSAALRKFCTVLRQGKSIKYLNINLIQAAQPASCPMKSTGGTLGQLLSLESLHLDFQLLPLEDVVSALSALSCLTSLSIGTTPGHMGAADDSWQVLPAAVSCLQRLQRLDVFNLNPFYVDEGWANLPMFTELSFEAVVFANKPGEDDLPGLSSLTALKIFACKYCFGLLVVGSIRNLPLLELEITLADWGDEDEGLALLQLPADLGALTDLQTLTLEGVAEGACPAAVGDLVGLRSLTVQCRDVRGLPALVARLTNLHHLSLGCSLLDEAERFSHVMDFTALGDLASLPALQRVCFKHCSVRVSSSFANLRVTDVRFDCAVPEFLSWGAVLQLHHRLRLQGRGVTVRPSGRVRSAEFLARLEEDPGPTADSHAGAD